MHGGLWWPIQGGWCKIQAWPCSNRVALAIFVAVLSLRLSDVCESEKLAGTVVAWAWLASSSLVAPTNRLKHLHPGRFIQGWYPPTGSEVGVASNTARLSHA